MGMKFNMNMDKALSPKEMENKPMNDPRIAMNNDNLTNEQAGAISRAHSNLKAMKESKIDTIFVIQEDITYAIEELEQAFTWLNVYKRKPFPLTPKKEDK